MKSRMMSQVSGVGAGSVSLYADANRTKLHRRNEEGGTESYDIRLKDILENGDMTTNVYLMPGDIISFFIRSADEARLHDCFDTG